MKTRKARMVSNMRNYPVERYLAVLNEKDRIMRRWNEEHRKYAQTFSSIPGRVINYEITALNIMLKCDTPDRDRLQCYQFAELVRAERQTISEVKSGMREKPYVRRPR